MSEVVLRESGQIDKPQLRNEIAFLEEKMRETPGSFDSLEVMHHFTPGIYVRTVIMHPGELIMGKIHKKEHLVIVSQGKARVVSEEFGAVEITAPQIFKSPPGVKRVLLILETMIWTTVHENPSNTEDLGILEEELIAKNYSEVKS